MVFNEVQRDLTLMTLLTRSVEETFCEEVAIEDLTPTKVVNVNERRHLGER